MPTHEQPGLAHSFERHFIDAQGMAPAGPGACFTADSLRQLRLKPDGQTIEWTHLEEEGQTNATVERAGQRLVAAPEAVAAAAAGGRTGSLTS